jgi:hypothetical protein
MLPVKSNRPCGSLARLRLSVRFEKVDERLIPERSKGPLSAKMNPTTRIRCHFLVQSEIPAKRKQTPITQRAGSTLSENFSSQPSSKLYVSCHISVDEHEAQDGDLFYSLIAKHSPEPTAMPPSRVSQAVSPIHPVWSLSGI